MQTLRHICEIADNDFKELYAGLIPGALEKVAEQWIDGRIIAFDIKPGNRVLIATESDDPMSGMMSPKYVYSVFRFFPGGKDGWHCSVYIQDAEPEKVIQAFLKSYK